MLSVFFFAACGKKQETTEQNRQEDAEQTETEDVVLPEDSLDDADMFSDETVDSDQYSDTSQEEYPLEYKEPSGNWSDTMESPQEDDSSKSENSSTDLPDTEDNEDEEQASRQEIVFPEIDF